MGGLFKKPKIVKTPAHQEQERKTAADDARSRQELNQRDARRRRTVSRLGQQRSIPRASPDTVDFSRTTLG